MLEQKAIETSELSIREAARAGRMVAQTAAACNGVAKRLITRVRLFIESGCELRAVVWEVVGDAADGVVHGVVRRSVGEAVDVLSFAVGRFGEVWERLARAGCSFSQSALGFRRVDESFFLLTRMRR